MGEKHFAAAFLIAFVIAGLSEAAEIRAEPINTRFSSETSRAFNPFSVNSWLSLPSQFAKFWFPLFQQQYYPSNLQTTPSPPAKDKPQTATGGNPGPKPVNIFGVTGPPAEELEYLPEGEDKIEW